MGIYVGIDPGKEGFSFEIDAGTGSFLRADAQPLIGDGKGDTFDLNAMRERAKRWKEEGVIMVVLEELRPPGGRRASAQTAWVQALGYAYWRAVLAGLEIRCVVQAKGKMKKGMGVPTPTRVTKKPEPVAPEGKRPRKPGKKASADKHKEWVEANAKWDAAVAKHAEEMKAWTKADAARRTKNQKNAKLEAIKVAQQYFPSVDFRRTPRCKGPDDNKCEAALYALLASKLDPKIVGAA
jgi:hypothetical protein